MRLTIAACLIGLAEAQIHLPLTHYVPRSRQSARDVSGAALSELENWSPYGSYSVEISLGTPPQRLSVGLALSNWNTWVPGVDLGVEESCKSACVAP